LHQQRHALDHSNPNLLEASAVIWINHPGIGLADLPVRRVQKANQAQDLKQR
jgi:hypothetical protein